MTDQENSGQQAVERYANIVDVDVQEPEPKVQEAPETKEPEAEPKQDTKTEEGKPEGEEPKKKGGFIKKLEQKDARIAELERQLNERPKEEKPSTLVEPKLDDFETYEDYYKAVARYEAKKEFSEQDKAEKEKAKEQNVRQEADKVRDAFRGKAQDFAAKVPDFEDTIMNSDAPMSPMLNQAIMESDMGPELMYHLAKNSDVAEELVGLNYSQMMKRVARLEVQLENQTKPEVKTTNAPPPIKPVGKTANTATYNPYENKGSDDDHEEYMKWRRSQKR